MVIFGGVEVVVVTFGVVGVVGGGVVVDGGVEGAVVGVVAFPNR